MAVITRWSYKRGGLKAGFHCIFIENNNTKNGKKKKEEINNSVEFEPSTFDSTRLHLTTTPQRLIT